MSKFIDLIRWYIAASPVHVRKRAIGRWVERRLDQTCGPRIYDGIGGCARMVLDLKRPIERTMYLNLRELTTFRVVRRLLRPGDVFVDAGANIGYYTVIASHLVGLAGKVYAFEPQPFVVERLRKNLEINDAQNVQVVPAGLWHEFGSVEMYLFEGTRDTMASMGARPDRSVKERFTVPAVRMDETVPGPVRLIKMDVEGADWNALRGAERLISQAPPHLVIELNNQASKAFGYEPIEMIDWLLSNWPRYRIYLLDRKRVKSISRDRLCERMRAMEGGYYNVWLKPV